ncbi:MAG TPA: hypothetical protein VGI08_12480, partial [Diaminobutyricibacter sp.]
MTNGDGRSLGSKPVEPDDGMDEETPSTPLLPPDDRLWRHPSEMHSAGSSRSGGAGNFGSAPSSGSASGPTSGPASGSAHGTLGIHGLGHRRVWAVAVVAGLVGALTVSGVGMVTGIFEQH